MFTFDLNSGYHHIEVATDHRCHRVVFFLGLTPFLKERNFTDLRSCLLGFLRATCFQ